MKSAKSSLLQHYKLFLLLDFSHLVKVKSITRFFYRKKICFLFSASKFVTKSKLSSNNSYFFL